MDHDDKNKLRSRAVRIEFLRNVAVVLGVSVGVTGTLQEVQAQSGGYQSPAQWSNFNVTPPFSPSPNLFRTAAHDQGGDVSMLPVPAPERDLSPATPVPSYTAPLVDYSSSVGSGCAPNYSSPYANAVSSNWDGACSSGACGGHAAGGSGGHGACGGHGGYGGYASGGYGTVAGGGLYPWFGGANLLFMSLANNSNRTLIFDDATATPQLTTRSVAPGVATGFDVNVGRYLGDGCYGIGVGYFLLDPSREQAAVMPGMTGDFRAAMPGWNNVLINPAGGGLGVDTVYNYFDLAGGNATDFRATRDIRFQGIEVNLFNFGLMGARRIGTADCGKFIPDGYRFANANGAVARPGSGRFQVVNSHGFRWFQLEDLFELAADIDGMAGYQANDLYYNVDTENNLFGYQFGSRVSYCLTNRLNLGIGGRLGVYGNHVEVRQRLGTQNNLAYLTAGGVDDVMTSSSDTVMSALGELDLGLGYRINRAWSIQGGYRMLGVTGVATAPGSIANDYSSLAAIGAVHANDSIFLHGGYVGLAFNW